MRVVLYFDNPADGTFERGFVNVKAVKILDRGTLEQIQGDNTFLTIEVNANDNNGTSN